MLKMNCTLYSNTSSHVFVSFSTSTHYFAHSANGSPTAKMIYELLFFISFLGEKKNDNEKNNIVEIYLDIAGWTRGKLAMIASALLLFLFMLQKLLKYWACGVREYLREVSAHHVFVINVRCQPCLIKRIVTHPHRYFVCILQIMSIGQNVTKRFSVFN